MDDLTAFLAARLDEDELDARNAAHALKLPFAETGNRDWRAELHDGPDDMGTDRVLAGADVPVAHVRPRDVAPHIARHDPARAFRDVEAKRAILAEHGPASGGRDADRCRVCTAIAHTGMGHADARRFRAPCPTLLFLAAVYSDHPDYREEWAVG